MVADFPADGVDAVLLTRQHDDPSHPFIHPQVQRILLGAAAFGESYGVEREPPPGVHVGGMQAYIAQRADITQRCRPPILGPLPRRPCQIMPRSGPGASIPIVVNAVEWYTVPGVWIACPNPTWASRQNRCNGLFLRAALPPERAKISSAAATARHADRIWFRRTRERSSKLIGRPASAIS